MRKRFFKKLSLGMALALVLGTTAHAGVAQAAAATWTLKKNSATVYLNEDNVKGTPDNYDFNFKNKPDNWKKDYSFNWYSENEEVATVAKGGVVTGVSVGEATIVCEVVNKKTFEVETVKAKVTVKANAAAVEISNAAKYDAEKDVVVKTGEVIDLNRTMYDENGNKTTKRGVYVTDYTRWYVLDENGQAVDETVATVNQKNGQFVINKAGIYALVCETYQSAKNPQAIVNDFVMVVVEDAKPVIEAKQDKYVDTFTVTLGTSVEKTETFDEGAFLKNFQEGLEVLLVVSEDEDNTLVESVKGVSAVYNEEKTALVAVDVTLWSKLQNGKTYIVKSGEAEDTFVASVGEAKKIDITVDKNGPIKATNPNVVYISNDRVDTNTLSVVYRDANGIDVSGETMTGIEQWTVTGDVDFFDFDPTSKTVTAYEDAAGKTITLKVEYIEYDDKKGEDVLVAQGQVILRAQKVSATTIAAADTKVNIIRDNAAPEYPAKKNDYKDVKVAANDANLYVAVFAKDSWGTELGNAGSNFVEFSYYVNNDQLASIDSKTGLFTPYAKGTVRVSVYYTDLTAENPVEKYLTSKTITIYEDRVEHTVTVDKTTANVTANVLRNETSASTNVKESATFVVNVKDNLGEKYHDKLVIGQDLVLVGDYADCFTIVRDTANNQDRFLVTLNNDNEKVVEAITTLENKTNEKASVTIPVEVALANVDATSASVKKLSVTLKKPADAVVTSYKVEVNKGNDINMGMWNSQKPAEIVVYGINKNGLKVHEYRNIVNVNENLNDYVKKLNEGTKQITTVSGTAIVYTLTKNNSVVKANTLTDTNVTVATGSVITVKGEVMRAEGNLLYPVNAVTNVDDIGAVTIKAKEGTYTLKVYLITEKTDDAGKVTYSASTQKCYTDFKVNDSEVALSVGLKSVTTEVGLNGGLSNKLGWTYDTTVVEAVKNCFVFTIPAYEKNEEYTESLPMACEVRVNGNSIYVKSVKVFYAVGEGEYVTLEKSIGQTITVK